MNMDIVIGLLQKAKADLIRFDKDLFELDEESIIFESLEDKMEVERKLHEVCINHRFAIYIEKYLQEIDKSYFVDIEYNRYYKNIKYVDSTYYKGNIRPDIIIHKRLSNIGTPHLLAIEIKKDQFSDRDKDKVYALMTDPKYNYKFGARVIYFELSNIQIEFCYKEGGVIKSKTLN